MNRMKKNSSLQISQRQPYLDIPILKAFYEHSAGLFASRLFSTVDFVLQEFSSCFSFPRVFTTPILFRFNKRHWNRRVTCGLFFEWLSFLIFRFSYSYILTDKRNAICVWSSHDRILPNGICGRYFGFSIPHFASSRKWRRISETSESEFMFRMGAMIIKSLLIVWPLTGERGKSCSTYRKRGSYFSLLDNNQEKFVFSSLLLGLYSLVKLFYIYKDLLQTLPFLPASNNDLHENTCLHCLFVARLLRGMCLFVARSKCLVSSLSM